MVKKYVLMVKEYVEFAAQGPETDARALSGGLQILLLRSVSRSCAYSYECNDVVDGEMKYRIR